MTNAKRAAAAISTKPMHRSITRQKFIRAAIALLGLGLAGVGVAAVFTTESDAGAAALLIVGALFVLFGALGERLQSLRYGDLELVLRQEADEAAGRGDLDAARVLQRAADTVGQRVVRTARSYSTVRAAMPAGPERTAEMERIISEARDDARRPDLDREDVIGRLWIGSEGARVWALGVLQARPELATTRAVLDAVQRPDQMFDQYHALLLAERFISLSTTGKWARARVADAVQAQLDAGALGTDADSLEAAKRVLNQVSLPAGQ